jgi:hypothetical protein
MVRFFRAPPERFEQPLCSVDDFLHGVVGLPMKYRMSIWNTP